MRPRRASISRSASSARRGWTRSEREPIRISTYPAHRSGWQRRDLIDRIRDSTGLPVEHIVSDLDTEGLAFHITLAVANRTASSPEMLEALQAKAAAETDRRQRLFIVVVPLEGGDGSATRRARTRLSLILGRLRGAGPAAAGMAG